MEIIIFFGRNYKKHTEEFLKTKPSFKICYDYNIKIVHEYAVFYKFNWLLLPLSKQINLILSVKDCPKIQIPQAKYVLCEDRCTIPYNWKSFVLTDTYI